jgi:hypothetical protein
VPRQRFGSRWQLPESHAAILPGTDKSLGIGMHGNVSHRPFVTRDFPGHDSIARIRQPHFAIGSPGSQPRTVG